MELIQDSLFGRTFPDPSVQQQAKTSAPSSRNTAESQTQPFLFLDLLTTHGLWQELSWEMVTALPGEAWTHSTGVFPSVVCESFLSQILEADVPAKYFLSNRACLGILRRAAARGKELPEMLRVALEQQSRSDLNGTQEDTNAGTILPLNGSSGGNQIPAVVCAVGFEGEIARTLTARNDGSPRADRGPNVVAIGFDHSKGGESLQEATPPLRARSNPNSNPCGSGGMSVAYGSESDPEKANALLAKSNLSFRRDTDNFAVSGNRVRRLTPLECERLQGLPDCVTDIPGAADTNRYKALGNGMAQPCPVYVIERIMVVCEGVSEDSVAGK